MDTSKKYILMCEKAIEIQKLYPINDLVFYCNCGKKWVTYGGSTFLADFHCPIKSIEHRRVWLPRQDQLQEILECGINIQSAFYHMQCARDFWVGSDFDSFEQLWLGYVMKKKFGKEWSEDKQDWIGGIECCI